MAHPSSGAEAMPELTEIDRVPAPRTDSEILIGISHDPDGPHPVIGRTGQDLVELDPETLPQVRAALARAAEHLRVHISATHSRRTTGPTTG